MPNTDIQHNTVLTFDHSVGSHTGSRTTNHHNRRILTSAILSKYS